MSVYVEIISPELDIFTYHDKKTQEPKQIRKQIGWLHLPNEPYPTKCKINIRDGQQPYQPGRYRMNVKPFVGSRYQSIDFNFDLQLMADQKPA